MSFQVPLRMRALNSSDMAWRHLGFLSAWADVVGSRSELVDNMVERLSLLIGL